MALNTFTKITKKKIAKIVQKKSNKASKKKQIYVKL